MKKVLKSAVLICLCLNFCVAAFAATTPSQRYESSGYSVSSGGVAESAEGEIKSFNSAISNYTLEVGRYSYAAYNDPTNVALWGNPGIGDINLYALESRLEEGESEASAEILLSSSFKNESVFLKKYSGSDSTTVATFKISDLYERKTVAVENRWLKLRAYDETDGGVCLNICLSANKISYDETNYSAVYDSSTRLVTVSGSNSEWSGTYINLALVGAENSLEIGYIEQIYVEDGGFETSFKFTKNIADFKLLINDGENRYKTDRVLSEESGTKPEAVLSISLLNGQTVKAAINANQAFYGINDSSFLIVAFYDQNKALTGIKKSNCWDSEMEASVPQNAAFAKAFVFESLKNPVPQAEAKEIIIFEK